MAPRDRPVGHPSALPNGEQDPEQEERALRLAPCPPLKKASPNPPHWKHEILKQLQKVWEEHRWVPKATKWTAGTALVALLVWHQRQRKTASPRRRERALDLSKAVTVSLSVLRLAAQSGLVRKALIGPGEILYQDHTAWKRTKLPSHSPSIQADLLDLLSQNGCEDIAALPDSLLSRFGTPMLAALPFVYLALVYKLLKNLHNGGEDMKVSSQRTSRLTRFSDVAGLERILPEVQEIVRYLRHPTSYQALGARPPQGILLHGPPGSGKTLLAQAMAGEADAAFLACSGSEFCEMYVGKGAARVRALFDKARNLARQHHQSWWSWASSLTGARPTNKNRNNQLAPPPTAIIFIDEFDALAKSRSYGGLQHGNDERESTLNQLLTEMDGFSSREWNSDVTIILVAATNRPDILDPAVLRRFDRQIHVPYPDANGRREILKIHARTTNCDLNLIDWEGLARKTTGFSGSDLQHMVNDAALLAVRKQSPEVQQEHLEGALRRSLATKERSGRGLSAAPYGVLQQFTEH